MNLTDNVYYKGVMLALVLFLSCSSYSDAQDTPFDKLVNRFKQGSVLHASFTHRYVDSYTRDTVQSSGTIWVGRNRYKVLSNRQSVVVDEMISRVYDENRNRLIISRYDPEEDDFAPSRFLNGVDSTYIIENQVQQNNNTVVTLKSVDPFSIFKRVEITISGNLLPLSIFAVDQADNEITTTFLNGQFIPTKSDIFQLDYPDTVEIIDMRN